MAAFGTLASVAAIGLQQSPALWRRYLVPALVPARVLVPAHRAGRHDAALARHFASIANRVDNSDSPSSERRSEHGNWNRPSSPRAQNQTG